MRFVLVRYIRRSNVGGITASFLIVLHYCVCLTVNGTASTATEHGHVNVPQRYPELGVSVDQICGRIHTHRCLFLKFHVRYRNGSTTSEIDATQCPKIRLKSWNRLASSGSPVLALRSVRNFQMCKRRIENPPRTMMMKKLNHLLHGYLSRITNLFLVHPKGH